MSDSALAPVRATVAASDPALDEAGVRRSAGAPLPRIAVLSSLFPSAAQPTAGLFIRERMFRVVEHAPLVVIAPQPWFPLQSLIRRFRPGWRPRSPRSEVQQGVSVFYPRFFAVPGAMRWLDGISMALCVLPLLRRLQREQDVGILDAHFAYPCGYAATRLGRWLRLPVSVTLRGTELRQLRDRSLRKLALRAVASATRVFSVSDSLRQLFVAAGIAPDRIHVVGNGVDLGKFSPIDRRAAREELGIPEDAKVLVSVGGLVERKGFHRVIALMPQLRRHVPALHYVIVGGPSAEGDMGPELREQVRRLGLERSVTFTGPLPPERIRVPLSASDLFVLPTRNEGWANVFLEAMACGLPVVTTRVGGNAEVVCRPELGTLVPFDDAPALERAIVEALERQWDRARIVAYARANTWDDRIDALVGHFRAMAAESPARGERGASR